MILTVEIKNHGVVNLLNDLESLGLIQVKSSSKTVNENVDNADKENSFMQLRGIHKNIPGSSVEEFLSRSREEKLHELAIEKRQEEERARLANDKLHS